MLTPMAVSTGVRRQRIVAISLGLLLGLGAMLWAQAPPLDPLRQCQTALRVEQDSLLMTKQMAAFLLYRAETAEARVVELERQLTADKER